MRSLLLALLLAQGMAASTYTITQVSYSDCQACPAKFQDGDTTIFTAWSAASTTTVNGNVVTGSVFGTSNDTNAFFDPMVTYGPNCFGRNILWWQLRTISGGVSGSNTMATKNCMNDYGTAPGSVVWSPAANGTCTSGYANNCTWKTQGTICFDGACYLQVYRQDNGSPPLGHDSTIAKTSDGGLTWLNPAHVGGTPSATGDAPAGPGDATYPASILFPDPPSHNGIDQKCARMMWITYGRDGATWPNVDNNSTYIYNLCYAGNFGFNYLMRWKRANAANLSAGDFEYYVCPGYSVSSVCDGLNNASWTLTMANATGISQVNNGGFLTGLGGAMYISELGIYVWTGGNTGHVSFNTAPHPWGPWTLSGSLTDNPTGDVVLPDNLGFVAPILSSVSTVVTGHTVQFTVSATTYNHAGAGTPMFLTYQISDIPTAASALGGKVVLSGPTRIQ